MTAGSWLVKPMEIVLKGFRIEAKKLSFRTSLVGSKHTSVEPKLLCNLEI